MKKISQLVFISLFTVFLIGCTSTTGYFIDRGRDAADIVTATLGVGIGGKVRVGPLQTGLLLQGDMIGLRGGTFSEFNKNYYWIPDTLDIQGLVIGGESFRPNSPFVYDRAKIFAAKHALPFFHLPYKDDAHPSPPYYYTQIEGVIALGPSFRLGFNPGELLDFILGWTTIDIFNDDLDQKAKRKNK